MCTRVEGGDSKDNSQNLKRQEDQGHRPLMLERKQLWVKFTYISEYKHLLCETDDLSSVPNMHTQACKHKHVYTQHTCTVARSVWYP